MVSSRGGAAPLVADARRGGRRVRPNAVRIEGDVAYLALTDRWGQVRAEALIDAADLPRARAVRWHLDPTKRYVLGNRYVGGGRCVTVRLHRVLLGLADPELEADHVNRDPLDNRRANLRVLRPAENAQNQGPRRRGRTGVRGVSWEARLGKFRARCGQSRDGRRRTLSFGSFATLDEARRAAAAGRRRVMPFTVEDDETAA